MVDGSEPDFFAGWLVVVVEDVEVVDDVVVELLVVVLEVGDVVEVVVRRGRVCDVVVESPGSVVLEVVDEVLEDEVVDDEVVDDEVVGTVEVVDVTLSRSRESGDAVNNGVTFTPSWAFFMTSEKILAGNEPPVTARPLTLDMGRLSGYPTHTLVASCGV